LKGVLVVAIVLTAVAALRPLRSGWRIGVRSVLPGGGRAAIWVAPPELRERFYQGLDYMRQVHSAADRIQPKSSRGRRNSVEQICQQKNLD